MRTEDADFVVTWAERYSHRQKQTKGEKTNFPAFISGPAGESLRRNLPNVSKCLGSDPLQTHNQLNYSWLIKVPLL